MSSLKPTLWRTCRALACETRLKMLRLLFESGELCVSEMAGLTMVSPNNASTQLRALNARGLITSRRENQKVLYRAEANDELPDAPALLDAVGNAFAKKASIRTVFRVCTAFTHSRRIEIVRVLAAGPLLFGALQEKCGMSPSALWGHLEKLSARGFVRQRDGHYQLRRLRDPLRRTLLEAACR